MLHEDDIFVIAKALKVAKLRGRPGMDEVAVRLNSNPSYEEREGVRYFLRTIEALGFVVLKKETREAVAVSDSRPTP